jgi:hypothetical protein
VLGHDHVGDVVAGGLIAGARREQRLQGVETLHDAQVVRRHVVRRIIGEQQAEVVAPSVIGEVTVQRHQLVDRQPVVDRECHLVLLRGGRPHPSILRRRVSQ